MELHWKSSPDGVVTLSNSVVPCLNRKGCSERYSLNRSTSEEARARPRACTTTSPLESHLMMAFPWLYRVTQSGVSLRILDLPCPDSQLPTLGTIFAMSENCMDDSGYATVVWTTPTSEQREQIEDEDSSPQNAHRFAITGRFPLVSSGVSKLLQFRLILFGAFSVEP